MIAAMSRESLIPPSPGEDEYAGAADAVDAPLAASEPIALFQAWLAEALEREPNDANAMTLATVDAAGAPDARMVLLKEVSERGFVFYSHAASAKGAQLAANPRAALMFHWKSLRRAVRVRGAVAEVTREEADAYFATRARSAQIGAWASDQSQPMPDALALEKRVAAMALKFGLGAVPRPPGWTGWRLAPAAIEFWRSRAFRLHGRLLFTREGDAWTTQRLFP
jgi:pyridoxamine 5'-phosphate oxidase